MQVPIKDAPHPVDDRPDETEPRRPPERRINQEQPRDPLAFRLKLTCHFHRHGRADAIAADQVGAMRGVFLHRGDVRGGHFLHGEHVLLPLPVGCQGIERLIQPELLGKPSAIKAAAGPVSMEEKDRLARPPGLKGHQRRGGLVFGFDDVVGQVRNRCPCQQEGKRQRPSAKFLELHHHPQRQERCSAQREEIVLDVDVLHLENFAPDFDELLVENRLERRLLVLRQPGRGGR